MAPSVSKRYDAARARRDLEEVPAIHDVLNSRRRWRPEAAVTARQPATVKTVAKGRGFPERGTTAYRVAPSTEGTKEGA